MTNMGKDYYDDLDPHDPKSTAHLMRRIDDERHRENQKRLSQLEEAMERNDRKITELTDKFDEHDKTEKNTRAQILQVIAMKASATFGVKVILWVAMVGSSIVGMLTWFWSRPQ